MKISHRIKQGVCIISIEGNLLIEGMETLKKYVIPLLENPDFKGMAIGFSKIGAIDSGGIGALIFIYKSLQKHQADLVLYELSPTNQEIVEINQLHFIKSCSTEKEALKVLTNSQN